MLKKIVGIAAIIFGTQALVLFLFGQPMLCECGFVKLWEGAVLSSGNSQHITDWYTFSHIIHGFIFYWILTLVAPRASFGIKLLLALGAEATWEILENTPWLIEHYRQQALAQGYVGDSILNSLMDTLAQMIGFLLAWRLPILLVIVLGIGMELFVGLSIRDNLFLNVLGFFHQFDFISTWQKGG